MLAAILHAVAAVLILAIAVAIVAWLVVGRPRAAPLPPPDERPVVEAVALAPSARRLEVEAFGSVEAVDDFALAAEVAGRVAWIAPMLEEGGAFSAGEPLLRIEDADYRAALASARARLATAQLEAAREEALATQALAEWGRLGSGEAGALTRREPQLTAARAAIAAAQAAVDAAERDLARCTVAAPYDGRVRRRLVEAGQLVVRGQALAEVHGAEAAEVALPLDASDLAALGIAADFNARRAGSPGPEAELRCSPANDGDGAWSGRVVRAGGAFDPRTRLATVIVRVERPFSAQPPLLPGTFVRAVIAGRTVEQALTIPRQALGEDHRLWLVDAGGRLRAHAATLLRSGREQALIAADLPTGTRLVLTRLPHAVPGQAVRVAEAARTAAGSAVPADGAR